MFSLGVKHARTRMSTRRVNELIKKHIQTSDHNHVDLYIQALTQYDSALGPLTLPLFVHSFIQRIFNSI